MTELHTALEKQKVVTLVVDATDSELLDLLLSADFPSPNAEFDLSVKCSADIVARGTMDRCNGPSCSAASVS